MTIPKNRLRFLAPKNGSRYYWDKLAKWAGNIKRETYRIAAFDEVLDIVVITQRGKLVMSQMRNAPCKPDRRVDEAIEEERQDGRRLLGIGNGHGLLGIHGDVRVGLAHGRDYTNKNDQCDLRPKNGALRFVDGAQSVGHERPDIAICVGGAYSQGDQREVKRVDRPHHGRGKDVQECQDA